MEETLSGLGLRRVRCPIPGHDGSIGFATVRREDLTLPNPAWLGRYDEQGIELYVADDAESAVVEMQGRTLLLTWDSAGCAADVGSESSGVHGSIHGELPFPESWVDGCGSSWSIEEGRFFANASEGPCTLRVVARDGGLMALGDPVDVIPRLGNDLQVVLVAPPPDRLRPWTDAEYAELITMVDLWRGAVESSPGDSRFEEYLSEWESLKEKVDMARAGAGSP